MRAVKGSDTRPELKIRKLLHRRGLRFRLGGCGLPGKPDIVLPRWGTAIFVHGCFWHGHTCARGARTPKANRDYWIKKIGGNRTRDERVKDELAKLGWRVLVIWECELKQAEALESRLAEAFRKADTPFSAKRCGRDNQDRRSALEKRTADLRKRPEPAI